MDLKAWLLVIGASCFVLWAILYEPPRCAICDGRLYKKQGMWFHYNVSAAHTPVKKKRWYQR